jgi:hypothetical protein
MKALKKNKTLIIILVVIIIVIIGAGSYFFIAGSSNSKSSQTIPVEDNTVQTISPSAIGFKLEASSDDKKVRFVINNASNIQEIEYELIYTANSTAEELSEGAQATVQRGITGQENVKPGTSTYQSSWLVLGSESANIVRYDTGVKGVSITLKITNTDGKVYQVQDSLKF